MVYCTLLTLSIQFAAPAPAELPPAKVPEKYRPAVEKGLRFLAKQQDAAGRFTATGGQYPIALTSLAGLAFLAEGSTTEKGTYSKNLANAVDWLLARQQPAGLFGNPNDSAEVSRYIFGQGYALLFLSQVYLKEPNEARKERLKKSLEKAVMFADAARTNRGGWGYVSAAAGDGFDEGCCTLVMYHGLLAAQKAGIHVPKEVMDGAAEYLMKSHRYVGFGEEKAKRRARAGIIYSLAQGGSDVRPTLTAMAFCCAHLRGDWTDEAPTQWFNLAVERFTGNALANERANFGFWELSHFYLAQAIYKLGEDGHGKMRPDLTDNAPASLIKWSAYRDALFEVIVRRQTDDGSFSAGQIGPLFSTALCLVILQLDNEQLPCCRR